MNAADGKMQQRWQYLSASEGTDEEWGDVGPSAIGHDLRSPFGLIFSKNRKFLKESPWYQHPKLR
jgi:hypothetical protein